MAIVLARVLRRSGGLAERKPAEERELMPLRRRETALALIALLPDPIVYRVAEGILSRYQRRVLVS